MENSWRQFTQRSTLHGMERAFNTDLRLWRRLAWMLLMTVAFVFLLYTLSSGVIKLLHPQYGTQITMQLSHSVPFPSVTFCPKNMFRKSYVESHPEVLAYIMAMNSRIAHVLTDNDTLRELALNVSLPEVGSVRLTHLLTEAAQLANETIYFWATFNEEHIDKKWFVPEMTSMGVCYRFSGNWTTLYPGYIYGLTIWSYVDYDEYFYSGRDLGAMGIKFFPHGEDDKPLIKSRGIAAGPGMVTLIGLKKVITTLIPKDGGCVEKGGALELYGNFSRGACVQECHVKLHVKYCGCKHFYERASTKPDCSCPVQCVKETYNTQVSWLPFPSPYYKQLVPRILKGTGENRVWEKIASITLYFETLDVTLISETQLYSVTDFFSDVGGLMGLCLGASVITWAELLEMLWDMCTTTRQRQRTKPDQQTKEVQVKF